MSLKPSSTRSDEAAWRSDDRSTSPIRKRPPPYDPPTALDLGLRLGPTRGRFLMSEVYL